nr:hypothetical protein [Tanacetum cinerariifolium]
VQEDGGVGLRLRKIFAADDVREEGGVLLIRNGQAQLAKLRKKGVVVDGLGVNNDAIHVEDYGTNHAAPEDGQRHAPTLALLRAQEVDAAVFAAHPHAAHEPRRFGRDSALLHRVKLLQHVTVAVLDAGDEARRRAEAAVHKRRVGVYHFVHAYVAPRP